MSTCLLLGQLFFGHWPLWLAIGEQRAVFCHIVLLQGILALAESSALLLHSFTFSLQGTVFIALCFFVPLRCTILLHGCRVGETWRVKMAGHTSRTKPQPEDYF